MSCKLMNVVAIGSSLNLQMCVCVCVERGGGVVGMGGGGRWWGMDMLRVTCMLSRLMDVVDIE